MATKDTSASRGKTEATAEASMIPSLSTVREPRLDDATVSTEGLNIPLGQVISLLGAARESETSTNADDHSANNDNDISGDVPTLVPDNHSLSISDTMSARTGYVDLESVGVGHPTYHEQLWLAYLQPTARRDIPQQLTDRNLLLHAIEETVDGEDDEFDEGHPRYVWQQLLSNDAWSVPKALHGHSAADHKARLDKWLATLNV